MSGEYLLEPLPVALATQGAGALESQVLAVHAETITVSKRVRRTLVRATCTTQTRDVVVEEALTCDQVIVERVPIGRVVKAVPPVRQDGEVTIVSVVEEEIVVTRRLVLKEEVHMRRVRAVKHFRETVPLHEQQVVITRTDLED